MAARSRRTTPKTPSRRTGRGRRGKRQLPQRLRLQLALAASGAALLAGLAVSRVPALPALPTLTESRPPVVTATPTGQQAQFIGRVGSAAQRFRTTVGLPPSLVTAMAINETGWGSSDLSARANNYFGIKAEVGDGPSGHIMYDTQEVIDGRVVVVRAPFRAYGSLDESIQDLGAFLHANSRYDALWSRAEDPRATARALAQAGYATDPDWASKLIALIDTFGLESLDTQVWLPQWPTWPLAPEKF
jgi:lysozyme